MSASFVIFLDN